MKLLGFLSALCCALASGYVSHDAGKKIDRWEVAATRTGIPKEEAVQLAKSVADKYKLCAVTLIMEEDGRIGVLLATTISDTGGVIIYFKHSAAGWIEDESEFGTWNGKRNANQTPEDNAGRTPPLWDRPAAFPRRLPDVSQP